MSSYTPLWDERPRTSVGPRPGFGQGRFQQSRHVDHQRHVAAIGDRTAKDARDLAQSLAKMLQDRLLASDDRVGHQPGQPAILAAAPPPHDRVRDVRPAAQKTVAGIKRHGFAPQVQNTPAIMKGRVPGSSWQDST